MRGPGQEAGRWGGGGLDKARAICYTEGRVLSYERDEVGHDGDWRQIRGGGQVSCPRDRR